MAGTLLVAYLPPSHVRLQEDHPTLGVHQQLLEPAAAAQPPAVPEGKWLGRAVVQHRFGGGISCPPPPTPLQYDHACAAGAASQGLAVAAAVHGQPGLPAEESAGCAAAAAAGAAVGTASGQVAGGAHDCCPACGQPAVRYVGKVGKRNPSDPTSMWHPDIRPCWHVSLLPVPRTLGCTTKQKRMAAWTPYWASVRPSCAGKQCAALPARLSMLRLTPAARRPQLQTRATS